VKLQLMSHDVPRT